jgi:hypothetical protein
MHGTGQFFRSTSWTPVPIIYKTHEFTLLYPYSLCNENNSKILYFPTRKLRTRMIRDTERPSRPKGPRQVVFFWLRVPVWGYLGGGLLMFPRKNG